MSHPKMSERNKKMWANPKTVERMLAGHEKAKEGFKKMSEYDKAVRRWRSAKAQKK